MNCRTRARAYPVDSKDSAKPAMVAVIPGALAAPAPTQPRSPQPEAGELNRARARWARSSGRLRARSSRRGLIRLAATTAMLQLPARSQRKRTAARRRAAQARSSARRTRTSVTARDETRRSPGCQRDSSPSEMTRAAAMYPSGNSSRYTNEQINASGAPITEMNSGTTRRRAEQERRPDQQGPTGSLQWQVGDRAREYRPEREQDGADEARPMTSSAAKSSADPHCAQPDGFDRRKHVGPDPPRSPPVARSARWDRARSGCRRCAPLADFESGAHDVDVAGDRSVDPRLTRHDLR